AFIEYGAGIGALKLSRSRHYVNIAALRTWREILGRYCAVKRGLSDTHTHDLKRNPNCADAV
ncbi:hypothetical protein, partial [uncultured Campylobacter sp.]|uniref:hypothetical protein n=1 Tax=uncultured Campylobacter sp. TaxID=218934 RepID=UPI0026226381